MPVCGILQQREQGRHHGTDTTARPDEEPFKPGTPAGRRQRVEVFAQDTASGGDTIIVRQVPGKLGFYGADGLLELWVAIL
ncbi:MAG: hypothetical protein NT151_13715 [Acidobacteria bacterium]|jgi:hypothetical protein|nr:hypothetical protein [Acidobacteriota bacterium]